MKADFLTVHAVRKQAVENREMFVGAKWTELDRSGPNRVACGTITAGFVSRAAYLQQTAESAASSRFTCSVAANQVLLNSDHILHIWPP